MGEIMAFVVLGTHNHLQLSAMSKFDEIIPLYAAGAKKTHDMQSVDLVDTLLLFDIIAVGF